MDSRQRPKKEEVREELQDRNSSSEGGAVFEGIISVNSTNGEGPEDLQEGTHGEPVHQNETRRVRSELRGSWCRADRAL